MEKQKETIITIEYLTLYQLDKLKSIEKRLWRALAKPSRIYDYIDKEKFL